MFITDRGRLAHVLLPPRHHADCLGIVTVAFAALYQD
jgi:hypothetical protein